MPEETKPTQPPEPQTLSSEPVKEVEIKPKKTSKLPLILGGVVVLALLAAAGWYIAGQNSSNGNKQDSNNEATSSGEQTTNTEAKTEKINKIGYIDNYNVWVLDVTTKNKTQITKDAAIKTTGVQYQTPIFLDSKNFVFVKVTKSGSELWKGKFDGAKFSVEQNKTFKSRIFLTDITSDEKYMVFSNRVGGRVKLHLFDLNSDKDLVLDDKAEIGRGVGADDASYARFSPDGTKILQVDTITGGDIAVWDLAGKKLASIAGNVTFPDWVDNSSFVYKENAVGVHFYNLDSKKSEKISSEKDWTSLVISPDGKRFAHNKGFTGTDTGLSNSSVGLFDLSKKTDTVLGDTLLSPEWVNDTYLVANKLRACKAGECVIDGSFTHEKVIVVWNLSTNQKYEVQTEDIPAIAF